MAHLLYDTMSPPRYAAEAIRSGFSAPRMNARSVARWNDAPVSNLADALERSIGGGVFATFAPSLALTDALIHQQDIRRPLNRPRDIPTARLLTVLDHPDPFTSPRRRTRGLRFTATDVGWSHGDGPEVRGTGEAIAMAIHGRAAALADLDGDGTDVLRARLNGG